MMVIDHIGFVVRSIDKGVEQWERAFGYSKATPIVTNSRQKVKVVFLVKRGSITVKLVEPDGPESPVFAHAQRGGGLHHICFRCGDMTSEIPLLKQSGARMLVPPEPGEAFKNRNIAFFLAENGVNFELIDTAEKEGWLQQEPAAADREEFSRL